MRAQGIVEACRPLSIRFRKVEKDVMVFPVFVFIEPGNEHAGFEHLDYMARRADDQCGLAPVWPLGFPVSVGRDRRWLRSPGVKRRRRAESPPGAGPADWKTRRYKTDVSE